MLTKRQIDHIVYTVPDLEKSMDWLEELTGIRPNFGGYHTTKGTKNALLNLGNTCYLEILAADSDNTAIPTPRWMGVDFLTKPQITRWSLKSNNLPKDSLAVKAYNPAMGLIDGGQRKMTDGNLLRWEMILPLAAPEVALIPFMTDWQNSAIHPTDSMPEQCQLISLCFTHPDPNSLRTTLNNLFLDIEVIKGDAIAIKMKMNTPNGIVEI